MLNVSTALATDTILAEDGTDKIVDVTFRIVFEISSELTFSNSQPSGLATLWVLFTCFGVSQLSDTRLDYEYSLILYIRQSGAGEKRTIKAGPNESR